jgi:hypothetical protein
LSVSDPAGDEEDGCLRRPTSHGDNLRIRQIFAGIVLLLLAMECAMAQAPEKIRVLYVGDSDLTAGTVSASSNFTYDQRGVGITVAAQKILDAWRKDPHYEVTYLTGWDMRTQLPVWFGLTLAGTRDFDAITAS